MRRYLLEAEQARLQTARAELVRALRDSPLDPAAQAIERLPRAGDNGWTSAWISALHQTREAAERWSLAIEQLHATLPRLEPSAAVTRLAQQLRALAHQATALIGECARLRIF